jgi:glycosyltransferase involved in cell wall biosynthesis
MKVSVDLVAPTDLPRAGAKAIRVALTEKHGIAVEMSRYPPPGVTYSFATPIPQRFRLVGSVIKGYLGRYEAGDHDLLEAVMSPILTHSPWIYSSGNFIQATSFNVLGAPLPRRMRVQYIASLLAKKNFKKMIFRSRAGLTTMHSYGRIDDPALLAKATVVYPAVRRVPDVAVDLRRRAVNILFSGEFFRKGGVNVVDAFERAQHLYPSITLTLCCDGQIDFNTPNRALKKQYLTRLAGNPAIHNLGRVARDDFVERILPSADIFAMPSYVEVFGFALLEAMAFGIPIISTNHFAIPEMVEHSTSALLVDTSRFDCEQLFRGYVVREIPDDFCEHVTDAVFRYLCMLIESPELRHRLGSAGQAIARTRFSFEARHAAMLQVYEEALR